ncbi:MAG TPA: hypothetical protein DDW54_02910 [Clostridiales bacterium]|nr:hypothetical protein [Clostridiales bacterium]
MKRKVGIIGYGWVASENHRWSYSQAKDVEIAAVCDVKRDALERAKKDFGLSDDRLFDDYRKLIDSGLCDMVDICTPNRFHCEQAKYALNAGLPVSIEKPVGVNSREVNEVRTLAEKKGLPVFICFTWRHLPTTRYLKDVIDSGAVGKVYHCYIKCIKESGLWAGRRLEWRFQKEYAGSGVLCDLGSHMIDFLNWMNEDIVGLSANMGIFVKKRQKLDSDEWADVTTDDYANIIADLKSGATANIDLSRCAKTEGQLVEFIIYGEKGYIRYCNYVGEGLEICYGSKDDIAKGKVRVPTPEKYGKVGSIYQSQSFVDLANGKKDNFTSTIDDGLKAQMVIDAAIKASEEKRYVTIEEIRNGLK